jgi:hypothetical protein
MQRRWLALFVAACASDTLDLAPDPIDWTDFANQSTSQQITGIDEEISVTLQASLASGAPQIEYQLGGSAWALISPEQPATVVVAPGTTIQFRVSGAAGDAAFITVSNASMVGQLLDTAMGVVTSKVSGDGSPLAPYVAPVPAPASCAAFLAAYPEQAGRDGLYRIEPSKPLDAYCDMTRDGAGWTLVARVIGSSTTHTTAGTIGALTGPMQPTTAKYDDPTINALGFKTARLAIEGVGTMYARVSSLSFGSKSWRAPSSAARKLEGPYTFTFLTDTSCDSDCGVAIVEEDMGFGSRCGYRFYASGGNPRGGMGCKGATSKFGAVWVR